MEGKTLYEIDRERAKIGLSPEQLVYMEGLEKIADDLYDSLSVVDFMRDEDE